MAEGAIRVQNWEWPDLDLVRDHHALVTGSGPEEKIGNYPHQSKIDVLFLNN
jgi:hypothetical protein